ncbi:hypothetical protein HanIR_Chr09g0416461 [Helianthus annuus]|nr:hypothetical protein HanIR_Chr09g0416461 [Helianthus annuus]
MLPQHRVDGVDQGLVKLRRPPVRFEEASSLSRKATIQSPSHECEDLVGRQAEAQLRRLSLLSCRLPTASLLFVVYFGNNRI